MLFFVKTLGAVLTAIAVIFTINATANKDRSPVKLKSQPVAEEKTAPEEKAPKDEKIVATKTATSSNLSSLKIIKPERNPVSKVPAKKSGPATKISPDSPTTKPSATTSIPSNSYPAVVDWSEVNKKTREAIVNIICYSRAGGYFMPVSGSGVFINKSGVILTNAHVGQYFLIKDYPVKNFLDCGVRVGNPAKLKYRAELLYLSPNWIEKNYRKITEDKPSGNGEEDYALLKISASADPRTPLPDLFPFLPFETDDNKIIENGNVSLASYPADFIGNILTQTDLGLISSIGKISDLFTIKGKTLDIIGINGSILAQGGSSGGAVVNGSGKLIGVISAASESPTTADRKIRAATVSHINRSLLEQNGFGLNTLLGENADFVLKNFREQLAPKMRELLIKVIEGTANNP